MVEDIFVCLDLLFPHERWTQYFETSYIRKAENYKGILLLYTAYKIYASVEEEIRRGSKKNGIPHREAKKF